MTLVHDDGTPYTRSELDAMRAKDAYDGSVMPDDLVRALRDPSITIANEHSIRLADGRTLWDHLREWREAPSNTASAGGDDA